ncbi:hypothetical protein L1987_00532 [Smallanthus sonchifolius]|uniref:Uncharacterized protein n=1 Tax=Smallanthus sonchifolius TaxID=185202 RepID=A0ACB9K2I9_9ASTR|nr:hypothetical protein L1987_00532 [Smallanthus sonchifolius]
MQCYVMHTPHQCVFKFRKVRNDEQVCLGLGFWNWNVIGVSPGEANGVGQVFALILLHLQFLLMAKKKDASTGSVDASVLRRSGRETTLRKQITSGPVHFRKSERIEKHTSPSPSPVKNKLEKQMEPNPLRRSDRGKKLVEIPDLPNIKSTKEKSANTSKQCSEDDNEVKQTEKQDPDVGGRKRKSFTALHYKAIFKPQRIRVESDHEEDSKVEDKLPQANTSRKEDVDKELKSQNSASVQEVPSKDYKVILEERVIDLEQIENGDCPQTKSLDGKSIESGDVDKQIGGNFSPSKRNIGDNDNHMLHPSSYRIEHDLEENQQEPDTCHKVTGICKVAGIMENAENNDASSNIQNSKFLEFWVPVQISNVQLEQYCATLLSNADALRSSSKNELLETLKKVFITIRKCCNHPYTVDPKLQESLIKDKEQSIILDIGVKASGKFHFLDHILPEIQKQQLRVLILFQPTSDTLSGFHSLGELLVDYVHKRFGQNSYEQLEGAGNISLKKQAAINAFNKDMSRFIFLLESRACHPNIKLSSVDVIIIFDNELNPSNDLKSLQKISIDSQSEQIMIFRLYSSSTLEEKILKLAENNMAIDIRSQSLRSNYGALLTWGASDLFDKLTKFHSQTALNISSEESLLKDVVEEFLYIISHKCKSNDTTSKAVIIQVQNCGIYGKNIPSHSEIKTHLPDGDQPYVFWRKLLEGQGPVWKFVSESTPRKRKRPSYVLDSPPEGKSGVDGGAKTRRKTVNNNTIEPAQLKTVTEGESGGVNEGVPAANDESQSSSGDRYWSDVNIETSLLDLLKPTVSELCNILKFSEDVKTIVEKFLEFVLENYQVGKEHTRALQAFMISLCWIGSLLGKYKIDRSESFALAKKHFNFSCMEEEANSVYKKLLLVKETFLKCTPSLDCLKDSVPDPAPQGVKPEVKKSQHIPNVDTCENHESHENVCRKGKEEFEKIKRERDKKRASLETDYKVEKSLIRELYRNPSMSCEKLELLEREYANTLEEHFRSWEIRLDELKEKMLADDHSGNPEVAPTLPENSIEAQSRDEPVCEGANGIESTGSHTSEREMVNATVSSEQIGEVPAQQLDDDMEVDVAEKVDSSHENAKGGTSSPDVSHAVEDHNETCASDMGPHVDCGDMEMPAGDYNKENGEDCQKTVDVEPDVESAETGTPAGACNKENAEGGEIYPDKPDVGDDHNETSPNVLPRVESAETGTPAGTCDKEDAEDGEIYPDKPDDDDHSETSPNDVPPHVESAETGTPAGTWDKEDAEDGEIFPDKPDVGDDHNETSPNGVPPRVESAETGVLAGTWDKEDAEDGEIYPEKPDVGDDYNETSPNDVPPHVESAEMGTPADTCDKENAEDGEISPDTPDDGDDYIEISPNDVLPRVEYAEVAIQADNEENAEDGIIRPDALHFSEGHNDSCSSNSSNPVCAAVSQDQTPSVQPVTSPASDPIIPEIENETLQLEQLPNSGFQDEEINVGDLQQPGASQIDRIIPDDEPDFPASTFAENPSDTVPPSGPLLEPIREGPALTVPQSGENMEENLAAAAAETPQEEHQSGVATSVAPSPLVNALNMFDNLTNQVNPQMPTLTDPLQVEVERLYTVRDNVTKFHQETKQKLDSECEKEIVEMVAKIRLKYEARHLEADAAYNTKNMELETNIKRVIMNKILADAFRSKCQDLTPSGHPGMQQVSEAEFMQQMRRLSGSPSMRHFHGVTSSSPGQSSGSQQPPQPPQPPLPLQQPQSQLRPQLPLQIVHQPAALFSSMPSRPLSTTPNRPPSNTSPSTTPSRPPHMVNQTTSSTPPTTSRPPIVNQITPSTTPTTSRPRPTVNSFTPSTTPTISRPRPTVNPITPSSTPIVSQMTPSTTPSTSRTPPGINMNNLSPLPNRPLSIAQINMSAANLRVSTETRAKTSHMRPVVSSEPRAPAPHMRPLVPSEPRAPAPHMRPLVTNEPRAPAPHLRPMAIRETRAPAPHIRPFRSTSVSPDIGTHRRMLPSQHVISGPSQSPLIPPSSTSSPLSLTREPSEHFTVPPPPSVPFTVPPSAETPLLHSFDNLTGPIDNAPRWVDIATPQPDAARSQFDMLNITNLTQDGTAQSSSAHDLVCLSDDD